MYKTWYVYQYKCHTYHVNPLQKICVNYLSKNIFTCVMVMDLFGLIVPVTWW